MDYTHLILIIVFIIMSMLTAMGVKFFEERCTLNDGFVSMVYGYLGITFGIITIIFSLGAIGFICIVFYNTLHLTIS